MFILSQDYYDKSVLSLRTGGEVGVAISPVINPNTLKIEGWYATARGEKAEYILPISEVREFIKQGLVVDDHTALTMTEDMVRLKTVVDLRFDLSNKSVQTESGSKLGKVTDFAVDDQSHYIKKLYVTPPLLKGFTSGQTMIDRSAIVEITNHKIIVSDATARQANRSPVNAAA